MTLTVGSVFIMDNPMTMIVVEDIDDGVVIFRYILSVTPTRVGKKDWGLAVSFSQSTNIWQQIA